MPLWNIATGSLYRELRRMDAEGLVAGFWEASESRGPARRVCEITSAGTRALDDWVLGVSGLIEMLDRCLASHEQLPRPEPEPTRRRRKRTS